MHDGVSEGSHGLQVNHGRVTLSNRASGAAGALSVSVGSGWTLPPPERGRPGRSDLGSPGTASVLTQLCWWAAPKQLLIQEWSRNTRIVDHEDSQGHVEFGW